MSTVTAERLESLRDHGSVSGPYWKPDTDTWTLGFRPQGGSLRRFEASSDDSAVTSAYSWLCDLLESDYGTWKRAGVLGRN